MIFRVRQNTCAKSIKLRQQYLVSAAETKQTQNITQIELSMLHLLLNNQSSLVLWFLFALVLCGSSISKSKVV